MAWLPLRSQNRRKSSMPTIWSAWPCVRMKKSSWRMFSRRHCSRNSGAASTWMCRPSISTWMQARVRLLRGSGEVHTAQSHAIIGTPCDVPVPRKITSMGLDGIPSAGSWQEPAQRRPLLQRKRLMAASAPMNQSDGAPPPPPPPPEPGGGVVGGGVVGGVGVVLPAGIEITVAEYGVNEAVKVAPEMFIVVLARSVAPLPPGLA